MRSLVTEYSMPSELITDIHNMQVNDSLQLANSSYLGASSINEVQSFLYENEPADVSSGKIESLKREIVRNLNSVSKNTHSNISGEITNKQFDPRKVNKADMSGQKTNSFFNYIKNIKKNPPSNKKEVGESSNMMSDFDFSDSFHYKPKMTRNEKIQIHWNYNLSFIYKYYQIYNYICFKYYICSKCKHI